MQGLGELFQRMNSIRKYPPRLLTANKKPLHPSLQYGVAKDVVPATCFPSAGFCHEGIYYEARGVEGNLVNVRTQSTSRVGRMWAARSGCWEG